MASSQNPLSNEVVNFIQHQLPGLDDGEYQLTVSQYVNDSNGNPITADTLSNSYTFAVQGDRFSLSNPASLINSVFPDDNATGEFTTVLPHIVFTQTTFPWTRYPTTAEPQPVGDADVPTWLAVFLLDEDDVAQNPGLQLTPANLTIGDLFPPAAYPQSSLGSNYSYFTGATDTSELEPGQSTSDSIQTIDIPLSLFWQIAPTVADLNLMAHIRQVNMVNKATAPGGNNVGVPTGTFSIVFGTRLPQTEKKSYAYLVSLEELQPFLPDNENGGPPSTNSFSPTAMLRLAVLKSWTFFSTGESASFVAQLEALNGGGGASANTNLRLLYGGSNAVVRDAVSMGYAPLNHNLRTGGRTVSWYRGPLAPYQINEQRVAVPIASPDQAMMFDPTTGMFDASYATAWTLGRMLALQDTGFSTALYEWKQGLTQDIVDQIENQILDHTFRAVLNTGATPPALEAKERVPASRALLHKTIQAIGGGK
ncbi:MAG: hypothetical protein JNL98_07170 [Bryobacterales bacterium]|nr:hypothetical protein [Bryobacterales bacterium]